MLQYYPFMRAHGPHALIKSSPLHQCNHERRRILGHIPIAPQKLGDTGQDYWYRKTDHILNSCYNNTTAYYYYYYYYYYKYFLKGTKMKMKNKIFRVVEDVIVGDMQMGMEF